MDGIGWSLQRLILPGSCVSACCLATDESPARTNAVKHTLCCWVLLICFGESRAQEVQVQRDQWGIPHVFSETDAGAFYGLGYATAEDRAFQMTYSLRIIQGRLAEVVGEERQADRDDTSVDHDRKMRTFGFHRAAERTASGLDAQTRDLLQAYCDGVNAYFRDHRDDLHPLFARLGLEPEPWTPADCLMSWWLLARGLRH